MVVAARTFKSIILKLDIAMFISLDTFVQDCSQQHCFTKHNLFLNLVCNAIILAHAYSLCYCI